jgi:hypothetical protein
MRKTLLPAVAVIGAIAALAVFGAASAAGSHGDPHAVKLSVGYADTLRAPEFTPTPWQGDPGVTFIGTGAPWDAGALKIDNPSANMLTVDDVSVEVGSSTFDLWGPYPITVAGKSTLILTQTDFFNFDTSDPAAGPCDAPSNVVPVIHVTVGAQHHETQTFYDTGQVLDTGGIDPATCTGANEGHAWTQLAEPAESD